MTGDDLLGLMMVAVLTAAANLGVVLVTGKTNRRVKRWAGKVADLLGLPPDRE